MTATLTRTASIGEAVPLIEDVSMPERITVVYDSTCELCRRAHDWLSAQPTYLPVDLLAAQDPQASARFGAVPWLGDELVVVADDGRVWVGPAAFIVAMWTTRRYRSWSYRLSGSTFDGMARWFFHTLSSQRRNISAYLVRHKCDGAACAVEHPTKHRPEHTGRSPWAASRQEMGRPGLEAEDG